MMSYSTWMLRFRSDKVMVYAFVLEFVKETNVVDVAVNAEGCVAEVETGSG